METSVLSYYKVVQDSDIWRHIPGFYIGSCVNFNALEKPFKLKITDVLHSIWIEVISDSDIRRWGIEYRDLSSRAAW